MVLGFFERVLPVTLSTADERMLDVFIKNVGDLYQAEGSSKDAQDRIDAAEHYLQKVAGKYEGSLKKGLHACSYRPVLMKIGKLDRAILAAKLHVNDPAVLQEKQLETLYQTKIAKELLQKWLSEPTYRARKNGLDTKVVSSLYGREIFFFHPEDVDFLMDNYLHKQIARLDEHIEMDPSSKHAKIRFEGRMETVDKIRALLLSKGHMLFGKEDQKRYFYRWDQGLTRFDPAEWKKLPPFKRRAHAHLPNDYKLVIKSLNTKKSQHSWIELKDPTHKYNVGFSYQAGEGIEPLSPFQTISGILHVADKHEYTGEDKEIKKTVIAITKEQFETMKAEVEDHQANIDSRSYNLISNNCCSFVRKTAATVGVEVESKTSLAKSFLGFKSLFRFLRTNAPWLQWLAELVYSLINIISNVIIFVGGGGINRRDGFWGNIWSGIKGHVTFFYDNFLKLFRKVHVEIPVDTSVDEALHSAERPVPTVLHVLEPERSVFDYPAKLQEWQSKIDAIRKKRLATAIEEIKQMKIDVRHPELLRGLLIEAKTREILTAFPQNKDPASPTKERSIFQRVFFSRELSKNKLID